MGLSIFNFNVLLMRMHKIIALTICCFIISNKIAAQILPRNGSVLNYRLIGFSFPPSSAASQYVVEIAKGSQHDDESFKKHTIKVLNSDKNRIIVEVPSFGTEYTWRVSRVIDNIATPDGSFNYFRTGYSRNADTNEKRLTVIQKAERYQDAHVFMDESMTLYDMGGNPVWYLPENGELKNLIMVRDMKLSPQGTITFLCRDKAYEVDYNGKILWKGPNDGRVSGDSSEHYHHEFTRLSNGHYMVLGTEFGFTTSDTSRSRKNHLFTRDKTKRDDTNYRQTLFGTLIEYDAQGQVLWSYKFAKYLVGSDLVNRRADDGLVKYDAHDNSFFFDEKKRVIYVSFKNISRVIKISYPEGKVLREYGQKFIAGAPQLDDGLFCQQHSCKVSQKGYLYLFNNNTCNHGSCSKVVMLQEPANANGAPLKVWEYGCEEEDIFPQKTGSGGNVEELPDESLFVCGNDLFIVRRDKKIVWCARPGNYNSTENTWGMLRNYRASIITSRKQLEKLIWSAH
jgi:hypothetical protein